MCFEGSALCYSWGDSKRDLEVWRAGAWHRGREGVAGLRGSCPGSGRHRDKTEVEGVVKQDEGVRRRESRAGGWGSPA